MTSSLNEDARSKGLVAALQAAADCLSLTGAFLAVLCMVAMTLLVLAEIVLAGVSRIIPSVPSTTHIGWEYSGYLMGACFLLGAGMTFRAGLQIRVEALLRAGKGRFSRVLETIASLAGAAVAVFVAMALVQFALRTWGYGEVSQDSLTPLWIPQAVLALGAVIMALQMLVRVLACLTGAPLDRPDLGAASAIE
ncbi:TRAP transporter small permease [Roseibium suaedae]|uniref:TRAP transporter small permease protein n=1 Tax=Roseibium suaedae TaxID=735517 RepID=A0A1M7NSZ9_9HYPH|nr:TRAP transporter small permease [Roseibium suaedae]SHN07201.1 TRAP-type mannitol/chloroaromatic compound transport system, small permease component [Roseibium suaedae]